MCESKPLRDAYYMLPDRGILPCARCYPAGAMPIDRINVRYLDIDALQIAEHPRGTVEPLTERFREIALHAFADIPDVTVREGAPGMLSIEFDGAHLSFNEIRTHVKRRLHRMVPIGVIQGVSHTPLLDQGAGI